MTRLPLLALVAVTACKWATASRPDDAAITGDSPEAADAILSGDAAGIDAPATTTPGLLLDGTGLYPRAIRTAAGPIIASVVAPQASGQWGATILRSENDGLSFMVVGHIDDAAASDGLCCGTLFELTQAVGGLAAGTLLWSASIGSDAPDRPMRIAMWSSVDAGATWTFRAIVATALAPRSAGGLWEPELIVLADGALACQFSDETDPVHAQKLVEVRSSDAISWSAPVDTVAIAASGARPGMANVRRLAKGTFAMSYELCGVADSCTAHLRTSSDGWSWGDPADPGLTPTTVDGKHFVHAPTLATSPSPGANGRLYLIGQMVHDGAGNVSPDNGALVFANTETGHVNWYELPAPVPIAAPYDNFCPNYSSPLVPLDGGQIGLELATRWDGQICRAYFARGNLLGSGDAHAIHDGDKRRLVNVMSGLCLDVSGGSHAPGTRIQQWTCNDQTPQNWTLVATAGAFALRAENSGLCLSTTGSVGSPIDQQPCDGGAAQSFTPREVGIDSFVLGHAGLCLDDTGGSTMPGTQMQLWTCNDLSPQIWQFEPR